MCHVPMAGELVQGAYHSEGIIPNSGGAYQLGQFVAIEVRWCGVSATMRRW